MSSDLQSIVAKLKPFLVPYLEEKGINTSKHFHCLSPSHEDKNPSCNIVDVDKNSPRFYCQSCSFSGDILDAVSILEKKPQGGPGWLKETIEYLANKFNVELPELIFTEEQLYKFNTYKAYKAAASLLSIDIKNKVISTYIKNKKWNKDKLGQWLVGSVKSYDSFIMALEDEGFEKAFLNEIGLCRNDIFNSTSLIFSWTDEKGNIVGFISRDIEWEDKKERAMKSGEQFHLPKYNNLKTKDIKYNLFQKGKRFYGIEQAIKSITPSNQPLYIFEGQADVITAWSNELTNCIAVSGSAIRDDHIRYLKDLGIYNIIICLDGDTVGRNKTQEIIGKLAGNRDLQVSIVELPDNTDPDEFIRQNGIKAFRELAVWSAFEWRLNRFSEDEDEYIISKQMIPFIVNEPLPTIREQQCKILATRTGISLKSIVEELNILLDEKAYQRSRERQEIIDRVIFDLKNNPNSAETILSKTQCNLLDLSKHHNQDALSNEDFVRALDRQKEKEERVNIGKMGFQLGNDLKDLQEILLGDWEGTFMCFGGKPNSGKSAFACKLAYSIATNNEDVVVIYHSIDDTAEQIIPRLVTIAEGSRKLAINMVRHPAYWSDHIGIEYVKVKREDGYKEIRKLAQDGKLIVKDLDHGGSLPFIENIISYYQGKYPERRIVYLLDNFHKLRDFNGLKDERVRFKAISEGIKGIALRKKCCIISTVEYTKLASGIKPTDNNLAESVQLQYDANVIIHLYSEVADVPSDFTICHEDIDWQGKSVYLPRVEFTVGKNKISDQKRSFFMDFWPASSDYKRIDHHLVLQAAAAMKEFKRTHCSDTSIAGKISDGLDELF